MTQALPIQSMSQPVPAGSKLTLGAVLWSHIQLIGFLSVRRVSAQNMMVYVGYSHFCVAYYSSCILLSLWNVLLAVSGFVYRDECHFAVHRLSLRFFLLPCGRPVSGTVRLVRIFWAAPLMLTYFCLHRRYLLPKTRCLTLCTGFSQYFHHGCSG